MNQEPITVQTEVDASPQLAWELYTNPKHMICWNFASPDWHCPAASNDLRPGGMLCATMAARDGSVSFEFTGVYDQVDPADRLRYTISDGRKVEVKFEVLADSTRILVAFEPEMEHSLEMQREGWQAILDNYAAYAKGFQNGTPESSSSLI